ncbi:MAG: acyltransferase family protein [Xanthobacteraceae bacterium]
MRNIVAPNCGGDSSRVRSLPHTGPLQIKAPYRPDIDGLRAVAVVAVIAFHAKVLPGGFVGVDIFFVISGFLISGLITAELQQSSFSYIEFYTRRVRRLFPALIVMLLTVLLLGYFVLFPTEYKSLGLHTLAAAAFVGNLLNMVEAGYFDAPAITKPLLHLWSLGVEEQFYLVYPAIIVALWRHKKAHILLLLIGVVSFGLNIALVRSYPSFAFYLPFTRFWEFVAGALIGWSWWGREPYWHAKQRKILSALPNIAAFSGVAIIVTSLFIVRQHGFPGWIATLPVLGALLIIAAGSQAWVNRKILGRREFVFVGLISYPLYLWHWPLLVFGQATLANFEKSHFAVMSIIAIALSFLLAWATYEFIEKPIRTGGALLTIRRTAAPLAACMVLVGVAGYSVFVNNGLTSRYPAEVQALLTPITLGADYPPESEAKPDLNGPLVLTYGDSHAKHLMPGLQRLTGQFAFRMKNIGWRHCAPWGDAPWGDLTLRDEERCRRLTEKNEKDFAKLKPDVVIVSGFWREYQNIEKVGETLLRLRQLGVPRVVVLGTVPFWPEPPQTMLYKAYRAHPRRGIPDRLLGFDPETLKFDERLRKVAAEAGVDFISIYDVLCNQNGCLVRLGKSPLDIIQVDLTHFSAAGSWFVVKSIADRIFRPRPTATVRGESAPE